MKIVCLHCVEIMSLEEWPEWMEGCPKKGCDGGLLDRMVMTDDEAKVASELWGGPAPTEVSGK